MIDDCFFVLKMTLTSNLVENEMMQSRVVKERERGNNS